MEIEFQKVEQRLWTHSHFNFNLWGVEDKGFLDTKWETTKVGWKMFRRLRHQFIN